MTGGEGFDVIRPSGATRVPWANGRGSTRALTEDPSRSWRLSLADIDQHAPFSVLPGIDRILVVADGEVELRIDEHVHHLLVGDSVEFHGESEASAVAVGGAAHVVNLMTVRGAARFDGQLVGPVREVSAPQADDEILLLLSSGATQEGIEIEPGSVLRWSSPAADAQRPAVSVIRFAEPIVVYRMRRHSLS
ncbi:HutD family protein [Microbacterium foliorum]|jgi:environmental stress-induced protein Ves